MQKTVITLFLLTLMLQLNGQNAQLFKSIAKGEGKDQGLNLRIYESDEEKDSLDNEGKKEGTFLQSFPKIITSSTPFQLIPDIKLLATNVKYDSNEGTFHNLQLFSSGVSFDTSRLQNGFNFLVPNASKFGLQYQFTKVLKSNGEKGLTDETQKPILLNFALNVLSKEVPEFTKDSLVTGGGSILVIHSKLGFEWLFLKDFLSIYINANAIGTGFGVDKFRDYFEINENKVFWFLDYGLRCEFTAGDDKTSRFTLDLGFINNGGDINPFSNPSEVFIPTVQIGFTKLFQLSTNSNQKRDENPNGVIPQ